MVKAKARSDSVTQSDKKNACNVYCFEKKTENVIYRQANRRV